MKLPDSLHSPAHAILGERVPCAPVSDRVDDKESKVKVKHAGLDKDSVSLRAPSTKSVPFSLRAKSWYMRVGEVLNSRHFQAAAQTAVGQTFAGLFTFVGPLRFRDAVLAAVLYHISNRLRTTAHIGSQLHVAAVVSSAIATGIASAALALTLAAAPGRLHVTLLCIFGPAGLFFISTVRATAGLRVEGILGSVAYVSTFTTGLVYDDVHQIWDKVLVHMLLTFAVTWVSIVLAGTLVLPTLAFDKLRVGLAEAVQGLGMAVSCSASAVFMPESCRHVQLQEADAVSLVVGADASTHHMHHVDMERILLGEDSDILNDDFRAFLQDRTNPEFAEARYSHKPTETFVPIRSISAKLQECQTLLTQAELEPPWLATEALDLKAWATVIDSGRLLINRAVALETLLEGPDSLIHADEIGRLFDSSIIPTLRLLYAQIAASCAALSAAILSHKPVEGRAKIVLSPSWRVLEFQLASAISNAIRTRFARIGHGLTTLDPIRSNPQFRMVLYVGALSAGILQSMAKFEGDVVAALHGEEVYTQYGARPATNIMHASLDETLCAASLHSVQDLSSHTRGRSGQESADALQRAVSEGWEDAQPHSAAGRKAEGTDPGKASAQPTGIRRALSDTTQQMMNHENIGHEDCSTMAGQVQRPASSLSILTGGEGNSQQKKRSLPGRRSVYLELSWLQRLVTALLGAKILEGLQNVAVKEIPAVLRSREALVTALRTHYRLHFFLKYWIAVSLATIVVVAWSKAMPHLAESAHFVYGLITVCVTISETVDSAFNKGVLRIVGTVLGGAIGFSLMVDPALANNPYALSAMMAVMAALAGVLTLYKWKFLVVLYMVTVNSLVLQQYHPPNGHGSVHLFWVRILEIAIGVVIALGVEFILPRYTTTATLDSLGELFRKATDIGVIMYEVLHDELALLDGADAVADPQRGLLRLEDHPIREHLTKPLGVLEAEMNRETVVWRRGVLVVPAVVSKMVSCLKDVTARLMAMKVLLLQTPIISGRYTATPYQCYISPLHDRFQAVCTQLGLLGEAVAHLAAQHPTVDDLHAVQNAVDALVHARLLLRRHFLLLDAEQRGRIARGELTLQQRTVDDNVRLKSCFYAFNKMVDTCVLLARTLILDDWLQLYSTAKHHRWALVWLPARSTRGAGGVMI